MQITMRCWSCGATEAAAGDSPRFGVDLVTLTDKVGWFACIDMYYGRTLIFCSEKCAENQITKAGHFRKRPRKMHVTN